MDLLNLLEKVEGKFLLKQAGSVQFVLEWAEKQGLKTRTISVTKSMEKVDGAVRSKWIVHLIANYKI